MELTLGYSDKKGAHTIMSIKPNEVEEKLKWLAKRRYNAVLWETNNRNNELGWVWKHEEAGFSWCYDNDISNL